MIVFCCSHNFINKSVNSCFIIEMKFQRSTSQLLCLGCLHLTVLQECPVGTYKNVTGSDRALCHDCPPHELPHRAIYIPVRGIFNNKFAFITPEGKSKG